MALSSVEIETGPSPEYSIIWLHGLGADGHDFEPIVPELTDPAWPAIRFVFPHAPVRPITINGGMAMRAWYDISGMEIAQKQDESGIRASIHLLDELIVQENQRGVASKKIFLVGFSQGGAIVLAGGVRSQQRLAGIAALSTYLPIAEKTDNEMSAANKDVPIFMAHGSADPTVSHALGLMSRDYLSKLGYTVEWHSYPMAHQVCIDEILDLRRWITAQIQSSKS